MTIKLKVILFTGNWTFELYVLYNMYSVYRNINNYVAMYLVLNNQG